MLCEYYFYAGGRVLASTKIERSSHSTTSGQQASTDSWLTSKEIKRELKISSCELMHRRVSNELIFKKVGNAYFYKLP